MVRAKICSVNDFREFGLFCRISLAFWPQLCIINGEMFVRLHTVRGNGRTYRYLHIVENRREGGRVRQSIVGSLGRLEDLLASGDLEQVIRQMVKHCPGVKILRAQAEGSLQVVSDRVWGPVLVCERLWEELGLRDHLRRIGARRRGGFDLERTIFAQVLQRLLAPGSDVSGSKWIETVQGEGLEPVRLQHFYRSLGVVWKHKEAIEKALFERGKDLFNQELDLVFFDTTSTYFEGTTWAGWAALGKSKDRRPDHLQLVIGVVMRKDGLPIACEIWPGNTADVTTLKPVVEALRRRFKIRNIVIVADAGIVSKENLQGLEKAEFRYILGTKMRGSVVVRELVLSWPGRYREVNERLQVKEVNLGGHRYVVCFNPEEAEKDRRDREAILKGIEEKLRSGGVKRLINNRGYKRFLKVRGEAVEIDRKKVERDGRYDGKFVLKTTTDLPAVEVAQAYKQLTWIERLWRELKDVMRLRPIFHHQKRDNVRGHIFVCFLALYVAALLRRRLSEAGRKPQWDELIRDLSDVRAVTVQLEGARFLLRSPLRGCAGDVFSAVGLKPPPLATPL